MRILITGSNGMLGSDLVQTLSASHEVFGAGLHANKHPQIGYEQTDITNKNAVLKTITKLKPAIIVHAAAYTDVDGCELNPKQAFLVNTKAVEFIVEAANQNGAVLFFVSTDYVFDGTQKEPYTETDQPNPVSVYGKSKYEAEEYIKATSHSAWIIRTSWLFGRNGKNFFRTMTRLFSEKNELSVVNDQKGAPTYTQDLAFGISELIRKAERIKGWRTYHLANAGSTTWYDAALHLAKLAGTSIRIKPITSEQLKRPARRPNYSVFNLSKIKNDFGIELRPWNEALDYYWTVERGL